MSNNNQITVKISKRTVTSFLNHEVKDYAIYVLRTRAMPSIMDGLRVGARKLVWTGINGTLKNKPKVKLASFVGEAMGLHYNHGDISIKKTAEQLGAEHIFKYAPLKIIGQVPSLRDNKVNTAMRYLDIKLTDNLSFFKYDLELLEQLIEEGDKVEAKHFLPIVPIVLLYRTNAPGFGFSFRSMSYNLDNLIDNCVSAITNGSCYLTDYQHQLIPEIVGIKPENLIYNAAKETWYNVGEYKLDFEADVMVVTDLPYNITLDNYDNTLMSLAERYVITKFDDGSNDGKIRYTIKFPKGTLRKHYESNKWKFYKTFKLISKLPVDILNCIDTDGKTILFYEHAYQLIDDFVKRRLVFYGKRKSKTIQVLEEEIVVLENRIKFIDLHIAGKIEVKNIPLAEIKEQLNKYGINHEVLQLRIHRLTKEEIEKSKKQIAEKNDLLLYIKNTTIQEMYLFDLLEMKQKFTNNFVDMTTKIN